MNDEPILIQRWENVPIIITRMTRLRWKLRAFWGWVTRRQDKLYILQPGEPYPNVGELHCTAFKPQGKVRDLLENEDDG